MAKKGVVIFDGEDMFINPKKAVYSKTRGEAKSVETFKSVRAKYEDEEQPQQIQTEQVLSEPTPSATTYVAPVESQPSALNYDSPIGTSMGSSRVVVDTPISVPVIESPAELISKILPIESPAKTTSSIGDIKSINPVYEKPIEVSIGRSTPESDYKAPVPELPSGPPTRPGGILEDDFLPKKPGDDGSGGRFSGIENNPGNNTTPIYVIDDGTPQKTPIDTPKYVAPVPVLPEVKAPPAAIVIADPLGGGGSPILGKDPEVPKLKCPTGFVLGPGGECIPKVDVIDKAIEDKKVDTTSTTTTTTTKKVDEILTPAKTTSTTETTTTKSTSTTETTTTKAAVKCNPPIYAAPKYYKWVDKGNCVFELAIDDTQIKDAAPAPVLPASGQPIININYPTGLGTLPTTSTTVQTTTLPKATSSSSGGASGGGGGGGTPFPEEVPQEAPIEAPKKNYFWWYVGGALALFLLIKRKKKS